MTPAYAILGAMDGILVIAIVGLALSLVAALVALRRRAAELDAVVAAGLAGQAGPAGRAPGATVSPTSAVAPQAQAAGTGSGDLDDLLPVGVLHLDAGRRVDRANARAHTLLEVAPGRLLGRTVMETFVDARVEALVDGVPDGGSVTGEVRVGAGEPRTAVLRVHRSPHGGTWIILEDVTELRRLQQIRAEFIDNLSHELRTPLSTVSLLAETLARDADGADAADPSGAGISPRMRERIAKIEV